MDSEAEALPFDLPDTEVARRFSEQDLVSAPVVDADDTLLGIVTSTDLIGYLLEQY